MDIMKNLLGKMNVSELKIKRKKETKKPTLLKEVMNNPEKFKLEACIEGEEIIVKIKKRES